MQRTLAGLAVLAGGLLAIALLMGAIPLTSPGWLGGHFKGGAAAVDPVSLGLGFGGGLLAVWFARVPWAAIPGHILATVLGWRRNALLMGIAVIAAGVLLFY